MQLLSLVRALTLLFPLWLVPALCHADPVEPVQSPVQSRAGSSMWQDSWPTFNWWEGAATLAAGAGTLVLFLDGPPHDPRWRGGILFDDALRESLRFESQADRQRARDLGDLPYYAAGILPLVVDPIFVAWVGHGDGKAALNLGFVGLEAFSYVGLLSFISTRASVRERPDSAECRRQHPDGRGCGPPDTEAFWSGHTSIAAASAGIVCANHAYLPLWRHRALDVTACALSTGGAFATGFSRLLADRHYATDVIAGTLVGFGVGYAVPVLLHYTRSPASLNVSIQAGAPCPNGCVGVSGTF
jgi:membrane-associated phospholipid phosphatase